MKKIYISLFIFLLLIALSSFSYAQTTINVNTTYDFDNFSKQGFYEFAINNVFQSYDLSNKKYFLQYVRKPSDNSKYYACIYFLDNYYWEVNNYFNPPMNYNLIAVPNTMAVLEVDSGNYYAYYDYSTNKTMSYFNIDTKNFVSVYTSWGDVPNENIAFNFDMQLINSNGQVITDSNFPNGDMFTSIEFPLVPNEGGEGGEGGGEDGGEDDGGILDFITNFWSNLIHIVVPTSEQWDDLQDSWQDNILDKFNIQTWSFSSSSLDYNYTNQWQDSSAPYLEFQFMGSTCRFELEYINTLFNMPLSSFFKISKYSDSQTEVAIQYGFNGLTLKNLISFVLAIELTLTNIYLYNKFFNKGGGE